MSKGWIGVDLDGTLAVWNKGDNVFQIGAPIPRMVKRVQEYLADGRDVRIFTARVAGTGMISAEGNHDDAKFVLNQLKLISEWCREHIGMPLPITAVKDFNMDILFDDRAVSIITNTGCTCQETDCA